MGNPRRIMWNGTVRALPLREQLRAAAIAGCEALSVTPSDYVAWLGKAISTRDMKAMAEDAGVRITHFDPFVRWVEQWQPDLPGEDFPTDSIAFDADDFFRMAGALGVESFTAWAGFPAGRYGMPQVIDAFGALCKRAAAEGLTLRSRVHSGVWHPRPPQRLGDCGRCGRIQQRDRPRSVALHSGRPGRLSCCARFQVSESPACSFATQRLKCRRECH